jgi:hypothetical protein
MGNKYWYYFSLTTLTMAFIVILYFSYLLLWPSNPLVQYPDHGAILKSEYCMGDSVGFKVHLKKNTDLSVEVHPAFVDGIIYQLPSFNGDYKHGELNFWNNSIVVPEALPEGKYYLTTTAVVHINYLRDVVYFNKSKQFSVIDCKRKN